MKSLTINETPVRTSKSFNINNIKINDEILTSKTSEFSSVEIISNSSKVNIEKIKTPISLKFGLGEELTKEVEKHANQNYKITVDGKANKEVQFNFNFDEKNNTLVENIDITANEGATATLIIKYESQKNLVAYHNGIVKYESQKDLVACHNGTIEYEAQKGLVACHNGIIEYKSPKNLVAYHNGIIKLNAKSNSQVNIIIVNLLSDMSNNFIAIQNNIEENAKVNYTIVDFGGQKTVTNYYSNIVGDLAENTLNSIYIGKKKQIIDLNYIVQLYGKKSNVNIEVQGALKDKAKKNFKGTIDFKKGCKKAKGTENENCMLLSDTAKSIALPMLLCSEEDVEGAHSCSAGKAGEKELFYIMSRGFDLKEAQKLLVRANFNEILENIEKEELQQKILKEIDSRL